MAAPFDIESFYARVDATARERSLLRQALVRGLKDWYLHLYGYDRHGAETVFLLPERMGDPHIFGFAMLRILRDRRVSEVTKVRVAEWTLEIAEYESDLGPPFGLVEALLFLTVRELLPAVDLRYALLIAAVHEDPFTGVEATTAREFMQHLVDRGDMPPAERAFWAHTLLIRHREGMRAAPLIDVVLGGESLPGVLRTELCWAWVNARQPHLDVPAPPPDDSYKARFVADHLPFWVTHMRSWPKPPMVRRALLWLSRLGEDPVALAQVFLAASNPPDEQILGAISDIIAEHHTSMPSGTVKELIDEGIRLQGSIPSRRKFYRLGAELFGVEYLEKAADDTAGSVRQWAVRQLEKETSLASKQGVSLSPGAVK